MSRTWGTPKWSQDVPTYEHPPLPKPARGMPQPYTWDPSTGYWKCNICAKNKHIEEGHTSSAGHRDREQWNYGPLIPLDEWRCHPSCPTCSPPQLALGDTVQPRGADHAATVRPHGADAAHAAGVQPHGADAAHAPGVQPHGADAAHAAGVQPHGADAAHAAGFQPHGADADHQLQQMERRLSDAEERITEMGWLLESLSQQIAEMRVSQRAGGFQ